MQTLRALRTPAAALQRRCYTALPQLTKDAAAGAALPALAFKWEEGCAPVFSPRQLELHYTKHHKAYVDKLNALTEGRFAGESVEAIAAAAAAAGEAGLFNQAAQHFNHSFYWACICPGGRALPAAAEAELAAAFGSVDEFKAAFEASAVGNFGSGWTWLVYDTADQKLKIVNTGNAAMPTGTQRPVFTMDVWEHAYYKDFENRRPDYAKAFWQVVNWEFVSQQLTRVKV